MKVALVHDWLIHMRGGEKVLEAIAELYPEATIYTLFSFPPKLSPSLKRMKIKNSFLHSIPGIRKFYRWLLPFLPAAIKTLKIDSDTDLVISSCHCVSKGIVIPLKALHVCYCHTPMRYLWGFEAEYFGNVPFVFKPILQQILNSLRAWDLAVNSSVNFFISNSENVKDRIKNFYHRDAEVIYPPVSPEFFNTQTAAEPRDYYLVVSAFVPYKKIDVVIEAFNGLDRPLMIVGSGPLENQYRALRRNSKISFLGSVSDSELRKLYAGAKAVLFPTDEDFGIVPVEAQASGAPVIAYGKGGALESVKSGIFFEEQSSTSIAQAIIDFEKKSYNAEEVSEKVKHFEKSKFKDRISNFIGKCLSQNDTFQKTR